LETLVLSWLEESKDKQPVTNQAFPRGVFYHRCCEESRPLPIPCRVDILTIFCSNTLQVLIILLYCKHFSFVSIVHSYIAARWISFTPIKVALGVCSLCRYFITTFGVPDNMAEVNGAKSRPNGAIDVEFGKERPDVSADDVESSIAGTDEGNPQPTATTQGDVEKQDPQRNGPGGKPVHHVNDLTSVPNGGLLAWLQVAGSFFLFFNTW